MLIGLCICFVGFRFFESGSIYQRWLFQQLYPVQEAPKASEVRFFYYLPIHGVIGTQAEYGNSEWYISFGAISTPNLHTAPYIGELE